MFQENPLITWFNQRGIKGERVGDTGSDFYREFWRSEDTVVAGSAQIAANQLREALWHRQTFWMEHDVSHRPTRFLLNEAAIRNANHKRQLAAVKILQDLENLGINNKAFRNDLTECIRALTGRLPTVKLCEKAIGSAESESVGQVWQVDFALGQVAGYGATDLKPVRAILDIFQETFSVLRPCNRFYDINLKERRAQLQFDTEKAGEIIIAAARAARLG